MRRTPALQRAVDRALERLAAAAVDVVRRALASASPPIVEHAGNCGTAA